MSERKQIKVTDVLELLKQGMTRAEIREHLGLTHSGLRTLFSHPKLKGKKPHKQPEFIIIDDTEADVQESPDASPGSDSHADTDVHANADQQL